MALGEKMKSRTSRSQFTRVPGRAQKAQGAVGTPGGLGWDPCPAARGMDRAAWPEARQPRAASKGCQIRGLSGKSRTGEIRELIPFNFWADKAAPASPALLIHRSELQRVGSSKRTISK